MKWQTPRPSKAGASLCPRYYGPSLFDRNHSFNTATLLRAYVSTLNPIPNRFYARLEDIPAMFYWHPVSRLHVFEWFLAFGLVGGSFSYVFYLGTRWGRYISDPAPLKQQHADDEPLKSWERNRFGPPGDPTERDFA
jgi:hypothetical protein